MSETAILFAKPGAVQAEDRQALREIGVIVVEVESFDDVKLVRPEASHSELPHGELLRAAGLALKDHPYAREAFGNVVAQMLAEERLP